jgi:protoporphyrinogen/coproporphyrinogen III oxidase
MNTVAIIGGGITGLTAALRLQQKNIPVTLYEASGRVGGVIQSIRRDGYLAEYGPNTILETSPKIAELIGSLDLEGRRLYSAPAAEKRYIVRGRKPVPLPGSPAAFLSTRLFSPAAKMRLLAEPFIQRAAEAREESLGEFVRRRIGREFLDYAINPFVAGVYAGDPDRLSVKHAFPKLHALEQRYHSLLVGQFLGARDRKRRAEKSKKDARKVSFDDGLQVLIDALQHRLAGSIRLNSPVVRVRSSADGWDVTARESAAAPLGAGGPSSNSGFAPDEARTTSHSAVMFAGPAYKLPDIQLATDRYINCSSLAQIHYPPVSSLVLGFRREDVAHPLDGFGMLVPEVEGFRILGTLFSSTLFPNRAPSGHVTLTSYIGGTRAPDLALLDTEGLVELALRDLGGILGVTGKPTFVNHVLFRHAIPQYEVGYGRFKDAMNEIESRAPGFFLAGHYRDGVSLGDSIVSGHQVAERIETFVAALPVDRSASQTARPLRLAA